MNSRNPHLSKIKQLCDDLLYYGEHHSECLWAHWEAGEPTTDGGYRSRFGGKWYVRPDEPLCTCGLEDAIKSVTFPAEEALITMAMNPKPPTPDALQTIIEQLELLCADWEKAIRTPRRIDSLFTNGQHDAWHQARRQVGALIESIKAAQASGIYQTDEHRELVALISQLSRRLVPGPCPLLKVIE